jgi:hypothetical protein
MLCWLSLQRLAAQPAHNIPMSQRRINELAAALQQARLNLIENTGLRQPQEPLPGYFLRMAYPSTTVNDEVRQKRIAEFIATTKRVARDTASIRNLPMLSHNDTANVQLWLKAVRAVDRLPVCITRLKAAWQAVRQDELRNSQSSDPAVAGAPYRRLGAELTQTTELILVAYNALRDAKP